MSMKMRDWEWIFGDEASNSWIETRTSPCSRLEGRFRAPRRASGQVRDQGGPRNAARSGSVACLRRSTMSALRSRLQVQKRRPSPRSTVVGRRRTQANALGSYLSLESRRIHQQLGSSIVYPPSRKRRSRLPPRLLRHCTKGRG